MRRLWSEFKNVVDMASFGGAIATIRLTWIPARRAGRGEIGWAVGLALVGRHMVVQFFESDLANYSRHFYQPSAFSVYLFRVSDQRFL